MKKGLKILSSSLLLATLALTGCGNNDKKDVSRVTDSSDALLGNLTDEATNYTILDLYNSLLDENAGNTIVANRLIDFLGERVLELNNNESAWKTRYEDLVKEKLQELAGSDNYKVNSTFNEAYMVKSLLDEGYKVTCPADADYGTINNLACNYTDYVNRKIKNEVITTLLKQKYVLEVTFKDRKSILNTKKVRDVEYFSVSNSLANTYTDLDVRDFMLSLRDKIANGEVVDFASVEEELKGKMKEIVDNEYNKIGTADDYSQSIVTSYTNNYSQSAEVGHQTKIKAVDDSKYAHSEFVDSDSGDSAVISSDITSNVLGVTDPTDESFARKVIAVKDNNDNTYYYLVSPNAGANIDARDVLISETGDSSTYTYSVVRFRVINSDNEDSEDLYQAAKLIASNASVANSALEYYVKEEKDTINVYDDDVYAYLKTLYPEVFTD